MYAIAKVLNVFFFTFSCIFLDFDIILSNNFVENMEVSLPRNRILPYFREKLVNALSLQNYRGYFVEGHRKKLHVCALGYRKMHTRCEKYKKI